MKVQLAVKEVQKTYPLVYLACHSRHETRANSEHGVSRRESQILQHLDRDPPYRVSELATHLGVGAPTLSAAIARLEAQGFVERRTPASDKRFVEVLLTAQGKKLVSAASVLDGGLLTSVLERLEGQDRERVVHGLALLAGAARAQMEERALEEEGGEP